MGLFKIQSSMGTMNAACNPKAWSSSEVQWHYRHTEHNKTACNKNTHRFPRSRLGDGEHVFARLDDGYGLGLWEGYASSW